MWTPLGFTKCVFWQPISLALAFIITAKFSIEPATWYAKTFAASLADGISRTCKSWSTVNCSLGCKAAVVYVAGMPFKASGLTVTVSVNWQFSKVKIAVINFVVLAGYNFSYALCS